MSEAQPITSRRVYWPGSSAGRKQGGSIGIWGLLVVVGFLVVPPLAILIIGSLTNTPPGATPHFTFDTLWRAYARPQIYQSIVNSVLYAFISSTIALAIGGFLAWAAERTDSSVRHLAKFFVLAPVLMPAILLISGWILLIGPSNGLLNLIAKDYLGVTGPLFNIYSFTGMIWVGVLQELPLAFLWLWPAFRAMNPDLEEAALVSGASTGTVLRRITLPILLPTILAAWIIFFIISLGALAVPLLIGMPARIFLYTTEIYLASTRFPSDLNLASAFSLLFLGVTIAGIVLYQRVTRDASRFITVSGKAFRPRILKLGIWRPLVTGFAVILLFCVAGLPLFVLVWNAFMPYPQAPSIRSLELFTLKNFAAALNYGPAIGALTNSVLLGLGAGVIATAIGAIVAWFNLRAKTRRGVVVLVDQIATAPIAIPGMLFGVGMVWLYLIIPLPIYGTHWILLLAYVALYLPLAVRMCTSGLAQLHPELEEAGYVSGASRGTVLWRIVLRLTSASVTSSIVYVSLRSFREYTASIFLTAPGTEVFSVLVLDMWETGNSNMLSAYVTIVIVALMLTMAIASRIGKIFGSRWSVGHF